MCGLIGYVGPKQSKGEMHRAKVACLFQALLIADKVRGQHSTGYALCGIKDSWLVKRPVDGEDFVGKGYTRPLFANHTRCAIGHNRLATTGEINRRNAHPYAVRVGRRINFGIHNGVINGKAEIAKEFGINETQVDSEAVFRNRVSPLYIPGRH